MSGNQNIPMTHLNYVNIHKEEVQIFHKVLGGPTNQNHLVQIQSCGMEGYGTALLFDFHTTP